MYGTYKAIYCNAAGEQFPATIFLSSVTLSIRFTDPQNNPIDVYWLVNQIESLEETAMDTRLHYLNMDKGREQLIIRDPVLLAAIRQLYRSQKFLGGWHYHFWGSTQSKLLVLVGLVVAVVLSLYLWIVPWMGERIAMGFSKETEIELGNKMYESTLTGFTVDTAKTRLLNEFYGNLGYSIGYPVKITVVVSPEINAFAIPGGHIIVNDAILEGMKTPEELAALLGHEGTHIAQRHSLRTLFRSMGRQLFLTVLFGNRSGIIGYVASNADALKGLEYSRELETQADDGGILLMEKSHLDTEGMLHLMEMLQRETPGAPPSTFLSTHPGFTERIANVRKMIARHPGNQETPASLRQIFHSLFE